MKKTYLKDLKEEQLKEIIKNNGKIQNNIFDIILENIDIELNDVIPNDLGEWIECELGYGCSGWYRIKKYELFSDYNIIQYIFDTFDNNDFFTDELQEKLEKLTRKNYELFKIINKNDYIQSDLLYSGNYFIHSEDGEIIAEDGTRKNIFEDATQKDIDFVIKRDVDEMIENENITDEKEKESIKETITEFFDYYLKNYRNIFEEIDDFFSCLIDNYESYYSIEDEQIRDEFFYQAENGIYSECYILNDDLTTVYRDETITYK